MDECVNPHSLLFFCASLCFGRVKEVSLGGGPLNVHRERDGPLGASSALTIDGDTG